MEVPIFTRVFTERFESWGRGSFLDFREIDNADARQYAVRRELVQRSDRIVDEALPDNSVDVTLIASTLRQPLPLRQ